MEKQPKGWSAFAEHVKERAPDETLQEAITYVQDKDVALDMGAGALNETKHLLASGFQRVVALDAEPSIVERAKNISGGERLDVVVSRFEEYEFLPNTFDLVNARYSLPFMSPASFEEVFAKIKASLKPGGIFTGQMFGPNDFRNNQEGMAMHSREEVESLLSDMEIIELEEEEYDGPTYSQGTKHWHVYTVVARK